MLLTFTRSQGQSSFQRKDKQGGGKQKDSSHSSRKQDKDAPTEDGIEDVPGGRLQLFQEAWVEAPASTWAIIKRGFHWEWISNPPALTIPKLMAGAPDQGEEVSKLLRKEAIYQVPLQPCFSANLFSVSKAIGGSRLIKA